MTTKMDGMWMLRAPVVVKEGEGLSTYYYRTPYDAKANHPPRYPVPAIPMRADLVSYRPGKTIHVDSLQYGEDDPIMVAVWDAWSSPFASFIGRDDLAYHYIGEGHVR